MYVRRHRESARAKSIMGRDRELERRKDATEQAKVLYEGTKLEPPARKNGSGILDLLTQTEACDTRLGSDLPHFATIKTPCCTTICFILDRKLPIGLDFAARAAG